MTNMPTQLEVNSDALQAEIEQLAAISDAAAPAVTRVLWSETDMRGRAFVKRLCAEAGLAVREDALGNTFARWEGQETTLAAVATGSHIDAIPNAGRYDGVVGVLGALEAMRALRRAGHRPRRAIELLLFTAEEPTRFGVGCLGSRALAGTLGVGQLQALRDAEGRALDELRAQAGYGELALDAVPLPAGCYSAFVELHIEQGPLLEREGLPIGVVRAIAAPASLRLRLRGTGGHAGAVLMPERHDALLAGAEVALAVERAALASGSPDCVATTGVLRVEPGAINSIPSAALLEIDVRDIRQASRDHALEAIHAAVAEICARRGVGHELETINADPPASCDPALIAQVEAACAELGLPCRQMVSRAYHDSLFMARLCPTTMIFIPCRGGVSHRPDEYSSPEQIARGVAVLAHTLGRLSA
jgi:ureidoglycolate amidohydrolase